MTDQQRKDWVYGEPTTGTVIRIVQERGFAFVRAGADDYFLHYSDYENEFVGLKENKSVVKFTPTKTPKGLRACFASRLTE